MLSFQDFLHSRRSQAASVVPQEWSTNNVGLPHSVSSRDNVGGSSTQPLAAAHAASRLLAQPSTSASLQQLLHSPRQQQQPGTEQRSPRTASAAVAVAAATAATTAALQSCSSFDRALTNAVAAAGAAAQRSSSTVRHEAPSPVQPLSLADVCSGASARASKGAVPSGSQTPTGSGRRYAAAGGASLSRHVSAEPSGVTAGSWPAAQQQQQSATASAAESRRASVADAMAAIQRQQQLLQQLSSSRRHHLQQQQQQPSPPDAGDLLEDLDHRFASIKHSLKDVFSTQPQDPAVTTGPAAQQPPTPPAAVPLPSLSLHASAACAGRQQHREQQERMFLGEVADPFSLGNSSTSSLEEGASQQEQQQELEQQQPVEHAQHTHRRQQQQKQSGPPSGVLSAADSSGSPRFSMQPSSSSAVSGQLSTPEDAQVISVAGGVPNVAHNSRLTAAVPGSSLVAAVAASDDVFAALADDYGSLLDAGADVLSSSTASLPGALAQPASRSGNPPGESQQQQQGGSKLKRPSAAPWRPTRAVGSSSKLSSGEATPQPRAQRPKPSILQQRQQLSLKQQGPSSRPAAGSNTAAAAVASAGAGVLDEQRWASNALVHAKQQAAELQQQNDALVRVLERERQQHAHVRQQCADAQLAFKEAEAEWEVMLHGLRHDKVAAQAQLHRALAGGDSQEVVDAYDAALAASAARVHEAQTAAAALAQQLTEVELQLSQLQHVCSMSGLLAAEGGNAGEGANGRADGAAVVLAVLRSSPQKKQQQGAAAAPPGDGASSSVCGATRGLIALRQHQRQLEQQVLKQAEALQHQEREGIRLLRFKKQFEVAADRLAALAADKASAEAFAQEAGLRAAEAAGRADRLELKIEDLLQHVGQLQADRDSLQQQLTLAQQQQQQQLQQQQQQQLQQQQQQQQQQHQQADSSPHQCHQQQPGWPPHAGHGVAAKTRDAASSPIQHARASLQPGSGKRAQGVAAMLRQPPATIAVSAAGIMLSCSPAQQPAIGRPQLEVQQQRPQRQPLAAGVHPPPSSSDQRALSAVAQLSAALPSGASPVHAQLAALLSAIKAGMDERQQQQAWQCPRRQQQQA